MSCEKIVLLSECLVKKLFCYCWGHGKGSDNQIMIESFYIFRVADSFATRLTLMVHCHKLEYLVEILDAVFKVMDTKSE